MLCTNPRTQWVENPLAKDQSIFFRKSAILVPCGKCLACRINHRREWTARLMQEEIYSKTADFLTFTYDDEHLPRDENDNPAVCRRDIQLFNKRLRKRFPDSRIRFFLNSEYGPNTLRPHYHGIYYNIPLDIYKDAKRVVRFEDGHQSISFVSPLLNELWGNGSCEISPSSKERCGYCAKYFVDRKNIPDYLVKNFSLMSRCPGIGARYAEDITDKVKALRSHAMLSPSSGRYVALPRYYRNKIYSEAERNEMFAEYLQTMVMTAEEQAVYDNSTLVEANRLRAMTYKNKKSKL